MMAPKTNDLFKWADFYLSIGCSVIPLREGKLPAVQWKEFQERKAERTELMKWFVDSGWGMAIVCGKVSGNLVRIDFDDPADYAELKSKFPITPTFKSQRKGGGYGMLLRSTETVPLLPQKTFKDYPKLEVRGEGGITVVPPTPGYEWLGQFTAIKRTNVHEMLKKMFGFDLYNRDKVARSVESSASDELAMLLKDTQEGERSNNLVRIAGMLRARGIDLETGLEIMEHNFDEHWPQEGMDWTEARETFEKAWQRYEHEGVRYGKGSRASAVNEDEDEEVQFRRLSEIKKPTESAVLIDRLVLAGEAGNTVVAAPAKQGKTSLILDACISATKGEPVWGLLPVLRALKIAYIDQERKFEQIRENQIMMSSVIGEPDDDKFRLVTQRTGQFEMGHAVMDRLRLRLEEFRPDVVVIDGWGWLVGHRASDPEYVKPALAWLKAVRQSIGCATIVIHHFKKAQFASRGDHGEIADILDQIEGLKRLVDQAQTALVYVPIIGYDTFNLLDGRTNKPSWDPPKTVIDYDHTTLTHRAISADEGAELFDPDTYKNLWGTASAESRQVKGMLNTIRNRLRPEPMTQAELAARIGIDRAQISRWYSGRQNPSKEAMEKLVELYREAKEKPLKASRMPRRARQQKGLGE